MKNIFYIIILFIISNSYSQVLPPQFNLDFEQTHKNLTLPVNWFQWGKSNVILDSVVTHSGKFSTLISHNKPVNSFGSIVCMIPASYKGKTITLSGFMKIKNVKNGFAGLMLRIDSKDSTLVFNNMQKQKINGTKDWQKYSITLPYPKSSKTIYVAGLLSGEGLAWFDDFSVFIDGTNIKNIKKEIARATLDTEFNTSSNFKLKKVTPQQVKNLFTLCKIWGYLKYHNAEIAKGNINWDYELFRVLPKINSKNFQAALLKWIQKNESDSLRQINKLTFEISEIPTNTKWLLNDSLINKNIGKELLKIKKATIEETNYYLEFARAGNPVFTNENPYNNIKWDDTGYSLLSLFRYWNIIEYFYPYKHLIENNWDTVLVKYIPKVVSNKDELSLKLTLLSLIGEIHDSHANLWDKTLNDFYGRKIAPIEIGFVEGKPVILKKFAQLDNKSNIKIGDIVTKINGNKISEVLKEKIKYCPASNYAVQLRDVSKKLLRTTKDSIIVTFKNKQGSFNEIIKTVDFKEINFWSNKTPSHKMINNIGYLYPGSLKRGEIDKIMPTFLNKKGIIIDLRCYPSDFIVYSLGKYLMPKPTEFVKFSFGSIQTPGQFKFSAPFKVGEENAGFYKGKVVILINEETQSQAEYTTMALQVSPNAIIMGSQTAGADGNISEIILPRNIRTMISGIGVYYPNGKETQRIGIIPNIEIKPTLNGIIKKEDELLIKAIQYINTD